VPAAAHRPRARRARAPWPRPRHGQGPDLALTQPGWAADPWGPRVGLCVGEIWMHLVF